MSNSEWKRREFIQTLVASLAAGALDWSSLPVAHADTKGTDEFDAIIIGSGLGGLSCGAAFARQGFKVLVLEQHDKPGGYATSFKRPGGFEFDVSLHSTGVGERNGVHNLIPGFPEITSVDFVPHPTLYRAIFPGHDIRVPNRNLPEYVTYLKKSFPAEADQIAALFQEMGQLTDELGRLSASNGKVDYSRFPIDFPIVYRYSGSTWGQIVDAKLRDPKLKGIVSALWGYYGLPPSKLASIYYAAPTYSYLTGGGFYPKGRSQTISNAFVDFIQKRGGHVLLNTRASQILVKDGAAYGVGAADGHQYTARVVVSNANAYDTFHGLIASTPADDRVKEYLAKIDAYRISLSSFQVFLGLKRDLVREVGITDSEIFFNTGYDHEAAYEGMLKTDLSNPGYGVTLYDNLFPGYSPKGKNTVNLLVLQGYDHWKPFAADYVKGNKAAYRAEKERIADLLIAKAEKTLMPGLSNAIEVKEIGTPLTNARYTSNYRGAIYGFDQTLDNSNPRRLPHNTPIKNLYLSGAWTQPGHGYGAVIPSGLQCFGEIIKTWG
jgi:all-trans-retinol 13,14-reductase